MVSAEEGVEVAVGNFLENSQSFGVGFRAFKVYALELLFLFFEVQFWQVICCFTFSLYLSPWCHEP